MAPAAMAPAAMAGKRMETFPGGILLTRLGGPNRVPRAAPFPRGEVMPMDVSEVVVLLTCVLNLVTAIVRLVREVRRRSDERNGR